MHPTARSAIALFVTRRDPRIATVRLTASDLQAAYLSTVFRYVVARIGPGAEAEDVTADVFTSAFQSLHRCPQPHTSSSDDPIRAWLLGIARRKLTDIYRRRTRRPETTLAPTFPAPEAESPEAQILAGEAIQTLKTILDSLPELQREALRLKYLEELSLTEIGMVLGKSPNAVGQLLHRARQAVRARGIAYFGEDNMETEI